MPFPAPAHHDSARFVDLAELAARDVFAVDVDPITAAGARVELGADAHPAGESRRFGQVGEDNLGRGIDPLRDLDRASRVLNHGAARSFSPPPRRAGAVDRGRVPTSAAESPRAAPAPAGLPGSSD